MTTRYLLAKFIFSIFGLAANLITNIYVARYIGAYEYGQYGFIIASGTFLTQILLVTLPETYIYHLSAKKYPVNETNAAYLFLLAIIFIIFLLIYSLSVISTSISQFFWPNIDSMRYLFLGLTYVLLLAAQQSLSQYGDCTNQYTRVESFRLLSRLTALVAVLMLGLSGYLNLTEYLMALICSVSLFFVLFMTLSSFPLKRQKNNTFKLVLIDLYQGWKPISFYTLFNALYSYGGRYGIQTTAGSIEQGAYTYAQFLALLPLPILAPMTSLYMSHMTKIYTNEPRVNLTKHFLTMSRLAVTVYGIFCFFLITNAGQIIYLLAGSDYETAIRPLQWLTVFSFLHIFDLLGGNLFFCTDRIKKYRLIVSTTSFIGIIALIIICQFEQMTAVNLAMLVTAICFLQVACQFYDNIRFLKLTFKDINLYITSMIMIVFVSGVMVNYFINNLYYRTTLFFIFGLLYMCVMLIKMAKSRDLYQAI